MANSFVKQDRVMFESILEGFNDALVVSKNVSIMKTDAATMERSGDVFWRPQPHIARTYDGSDQTSNFKSYHQLAVPASFGFRRSAPFIMTDMEMRDMAAADGIQKSIAIKLASDINKACLDAACDYGSLIVARAAAASGYDDVAHIDSMMNEQGVNSEDRKLFLTSRSYNAMASDLQKSTRSFGSDISDKALRKSLVGEIGNFQTYKLDYGKRLAAKAASALTINTLGTYTNYYVPKSTSTATTGERNNVDNRFQVVTLSATTNLAVGDCFTIAACYALHHITKSSTGKLKTFRVVAINSGTQCVITPPVISNQGGSDIEAEYQNVSITTTANNSAITFLNLVAADINPFWHKDAIELLPGRLGIQDGNGVAVMRGSTDNGCEIVMQKFQDINTSNLLYRVDTLFGVVNKQPEMSGILLFSQGTEGP